ncbi:MAG: DHH family phosphoesterase [Chloroflexota bacterium]
MSSENLKMLLQAIGQAPEMVILPHNNPDPDAIASAVALRYLVAEKLDIEAHIVYQGVIGRAENKALVRYLVHPLRPLIDSDLAGSKPIAVIDTQPGAGNVGVAASNSNLAIVIDHHTWPDLPPVATPGFVDIRPEVGATSTILTGYLQAAGMEPPVPLATALFYGIKTNTLGLGRNTSSADANAYYYLQPRLDVKGLADIEQARVPAHYFKSFDVALRAARLYDGILISYLGPVGYPDLTAEMADLLLRLEESEWVICLGVYQDELMISVRLHKRRRGAGQLVQAIVGAAGTAGGHGAIAGGQIPLAGQDPDQLAARLTQRILQYLAVDAALLARPLFE